MLSVSPMIWIWFNLGVIALIAFDAFVLNPKGRELTLARAIGMTAFWILLALLFNVVIYLYWGDQKALEFLAGYVVEQSLSVDNLFVFLLIFAHFKTPASDQREILFWGIISAQILRAIFIISGVALLHYFSWMMYIFGSILVITGIKLFFKREEDDDFENNPIFKFLKNKLPMFWVVFFFIQITDFIFAVDSIPAVLAITKDSFIAYSSNIFAVLGLRAMYFALASFMKMFSYLHYGLGVILIFVGFKMLTERFFHIPVILTLGFIVLTLTITVFVSILWPAIKQKE